MDNLDFVIDGCRSKNHKAQKILFDYYAAKMMKVCQRYVHSKHNAEDALLEAFTDIFYKIHQFRNEGSFEGWVRRIVTYHAIAKYREEVRLSKNITAIAEHHQFPTSSHTPLDNISAKELIEIIEKLPPGYRNALQLFSIAGYSHKEISVMLNIQECTSRSQLTRAKKALEEFVNIGKYSKKQLTKVGN